MTTCTNVCNIIPQCTPVYLYNCSLYPCTCTILAHLYSKQTCMSGISLRYHGNTYGVLVLTAVSMSRWPPSVLARCSMCAYSVPVYQHTAVLSLCTVHVWRLGVLAGSLDQAIVCWVNVITCGMVWITGWWWGCEIVRVSYSRCWLYRPT